MNSSTVDPIFSDSTGWGLRPIGEDTSFFTRIELYSLFGKQYTQTTYLNPRIIAIDWEQNDSSSSDPEEVSITFKYEAIEYKDPTDITETDAVKFGFDPGVDGGANDIQTNVSANIGNNTSTYTLPNTTSTPIAPASLYSTNVTNTSLTANNQQGPLDGISGGFLPNSTESIGGTNTVISNIQDQVNSSIASIGSFSFGGPT
jgi:hypothetical protein